MIKQISFMMMRLYKNKCFYVLLLIVNIISNANAQVYQSLSFEEIMYPLIEIRRAKEEARRAREKAENSINEIYGYVVEILGHDIDNQLRQEMNAELRTLDRIAKLLSENGVSDNINTNIASSYRRVQKSIADYNNRVAQYNEEAAKQEEARRAEAAKPEVWSGTGFALKDDYIVTNYHVIEGAKHIVVLGIKGDFNIGYKAKVVAVDSYNDLAIIKIDDWRFDGFGSISYSVRTGIADVGEDVFVLGYPLTTVMGNEIKLTTGVISSRTGFKGDVSSYQMSVPIQPGNSGGPLFDNRGNLIGVVNAKIPFAENVSYAIKAIYIKNLVERFSSANIIPSVNTVSSLPRPAQIKSLKNFVFLLKCTRDGTYNASNSSVSSGTRTKSQGSGNIVKGVKTVYYPRNGTKDEVSIITKVELSSTFTKVYMRYFNKFDHGWCNINSGTYISGPSGDKKTLLKASNIPIAPNMYKFQYKWQSLDFVLEFPALNEKNISWFNLVEPGSSSWKFYDVRLD